MVDEVREKKIAVCAGGLLKRERDEDGERGRIGMMGDAMVVESCSFVSILIAGRQRSLLNPLLGWLWRGSSGPISSVLWSGLKSILTMKRL